MKTLPKNAIYNKAFEATGKSTEIRMRGIINFSLIVPAPQGKRCTLKCLVMFLICIATCFANDNNSDPYRKDLVNKALEECEKQNYGLAIKVFEAELERGSTDERIYTQLASIYSFMGKHDKAVITTDKLAKIPKHRDYGYFLSGMEYFKRLNFNIAIEYFDRVLKNKKSKYYASVLFAKCRCLHLLQKEKQLSLSLQELKSIKPKFHEEMNKIIAGKKPTFVYRY